MPGHRTGHFYLNPILASLNPIKMKLHYLMILLFAVSVAGCKKKNDKPVIIVTPADFRISGLPGDIKDWNISITSEVKLARLIIKIQPENDFETTYKDTLLYTKNFTYKLQYLIPPSVAGKLLYFSFTAIDEDGNEGLALKQIQVGDELLTEVSGLQFFTRSNPGNNAFDLENLVQTSAFNDSTVRDIEEFTGDSTLQYPVGYWYSPAGGKFVKANTYDYGNATLLSAKNVFDNSIQTDVTDSLVSGDTYIMKLGSMTQNKYVVLKVININDSPGNNFDNYTFNVKK
jgi:hypothetical protein